MSGHSKWANIKHRKAAQDSKRGREFTETDRKKLRSSRSALVVATRQTTHDFYANCSTKQKSINMPSENTSRAVKKVNG